MNKINISENLESVYFLYKLPCSLYKNGFENIIVGDFKSKRLIGDTYININDWFSMMTNGSLLPYVCNTLSKSYKIKEYINIYSKPDPLKTRSYISKLSDKSDVIRECLWTIQFVKEGKVNRPDVFKTQKSYSEVLKEFYDIVDPIYYMKLKNK